jgi:hypothetical protein
LGRSRPHAPGAEEAQCTRSAADLAGPQSHARELTAPEPRRQTTQRGRPTLRQCGGMPTAEPSRARPETQAINCTNSNSPSAGRRRLPTTYCRIRLSNRGLER